MCKPLIIWRNCKMESFLTESCGALLIETPGLTADAKENTEAAGQSA